MKKNDLLIEKMYASIEEIKTEEKQDNLLRVYRDSPGSITLQIRTYKPIVYKGKRKKMIATVHTTIEELEKILAYAKSCF